MQILAFMMFFLGLIGVYCLVKIWEMLSEMNGHLSNIAFHARRIPTDPSDR